MAKDAKGHGSERRATATMKSPSGYKEDVHITPSRAQAALNRGWKNAVTFQAPGYVPKVYENMAKAKAAAEKHPGFVGWKK